MSAMAGHKTRAGFSLLEMMIVIGILGTALGGIAMIVQTSGEAFSAGSSRMLLEGKGNRSLARVTELLRSAERATLAPALNAPASAPTIDFRDCLGPEVGGVAFGETQRIRLDAAGDAVEWTEDLGLPSERTLVICRGVPDLLEGETLNNLDDNAERPGRRAGPVLRVRGRRDDHPHDPGIRPPGRGEHGPHVRGSRLLQELDR